MVSFGIPSDSDEISSHMNPAKDNGKPQGFKYRVTITEKDFFGLLVLLGLGHVVLDMNGFF